jgi:coenzyme F420-reducing hydrogenase delta subunit
MPSQHSTCVSTATEKRDAAKRPAAVTIFVCANCARPPLASTSAGRSRPVIPDFGWPWPVKQMLVPCTGRIQPEHVLKALESGTDLVCAIGCEHDNCHYLEGSKRCERRIEYLRSMLGEIGHGGERLLFAALPGTAAEDTALAAGRSVDARADFSAEIAALRVRLSEVLAGLPPNLLHATRTDKEHFNSLLGPEDGEN